MHSSAASDATHNRSHPLLSVVYQERDILEELTALAQELRQALTRADLHTLETLAGRQERLVKKLLALEDQRHVLGANDGHEISEEAEGFLLAACEALRAQMREFQRANAVNQRLLEGIARWTEGLFRAFATYFEPVTPYDAHGTRPAARDRHLLIDRQA